MRRYRAATVIVLAVVGSFVAEVLPRAVAATDAASGHAGSGLDPAACLARHPGAVDDPDWTRFARSRPRTTPGAPVERYLERAAALCIARTSGVRGMDAPSSARLLHRRQEDDVVWIVTRTRRTADGGAVHVELPIDAVSGQVGPPSSYTTRSRAR